MRKQHINVLNLFIILAILLSLTVAAPVSAQKTSHTPAPQSPYSTINTVTWQDGTLLEKTIINSPPHPPSGGGRPLAPSSLGTTHQSLSSKTLEVPAFRWVYGCAAVSGAMIAGYYDRNGYPNIYSGPTGDGVYPLVEDTSWSTWSDGYETFPNNPLIASHKGVDGRDASLRGSIDDYWIKNNNNTADPYITGKWTQHTWGGAIGDYMKTSQSAYGNPDGATGFYNYSLAQPLTCSQMEAAGISADDGTYGRKLFYEARGYTVTDCYNQKTNNSVTSGFSFTQYKAEIDAGNPVMLLLNSASGGHVVVGVGYDDNNSTMFIHDTWDNATHAMAWTGIYSSYQLELDSVSIVHLAPTMPPPGAFQKSAPASDANGQLTNPTICWTASTDATGYEYCVNSVPSCPGTWTSVIGSTSAKLASLDTGNTYYWQVRARNAAGATEANGGSWWRFYTINTAPVLAAISSKTVDEDSPLAVTASATDSDPRQSLTYSLDPIPPEGATINAHTGVFTWTPTEAQGPGVYNFTVIATDNGVPAKNDTKSFQVTVNEVNTAPVIAPIGSPSAEAGALLTFTATASDPDIPANTPMTFSLGAGAPSGASIDPATGVFTWTPPDTQMPGTYPVTVTVTDSGTPNLSSSQTVQLLVKQATAAPHAVADSYVTSKDVALVASVAQGVLANDSDPGSNTITASLVTPTQHGALTLHPDGSFEYTPPAGFYGDDPFTYHVFNGQYYSDIVNVALHVNAPPTLSLGENRTVNEGDNAAFTAAITDPDGAPDAWAVAWDFGDSTTLTGGATATHKFADNGTYNVTAQATDAYNASGSNSVQVTVKNVAPVIPYIPEIHALPGSSFDLTFNFTDPGVLDTHDVEVTWETGVIETASLAANVLTFSASHAFDKTGTYRVQIKVTDKDGGYETYTVSVVVRPFSVLLPMVGR